MLMSRSRPELDRQRERVPDRRTGDRKSHTSAVRAQPVSWDGGAENAGVENTGVDKVWKGIRTKYGISELRRLPIATAPKMSLKLNC